MSDKPVFLTPTGLKELEKELAHLREVRRAEVAEKIRTAKEFTDTTDNAEFDEAKNEQAFVEGRVLTIERMLANAVIIDVEHARHDIVSMGTTVKAKDDDGRLAAYTIVGSVEANPKEGKISNESPVGQALLGRKVGDRVEIMVPAGTVHYTIVSIE